MPVSSTQCCNSFIFYIKPQPWLSKHLISWHIYRHKPYKTVETYTKEVVIDDFLQDTKKVPFVEVQLI